MQSRDFRLHSKVAFNPRMNDHLSRKGLHLGPMIEILDPLIELISLLRKGSNGLLRRVEYLLHKMRDLQNQEPNPLSSYLLELFLRGPNAWKGRQQWLEVFELCFLQGARLSPGSLLSVLI